MPQPNRPSTPDRDYHAIESTVSATETGRRFLAEYVRRRRSEESRALLDAIASLEAAQTPPHGAPKHQPKARPDLANRVSRVRAEIGGALDAREPAGALGDLARALARTLDATERLQELSWTVRERGFDRSVCDAQEACANEIHAGCGLHEHAVQNLIEQVGALDEIAAALRLARV